MTILVWRPVAIAFVAVLALWLLSAAALPRISGWYFDGEKCFPTVEGAAKDAALQSAKYKECIKEMRDSSSAFGDSFGAINALFSGLALAGIVLTIYFHSEGAKRSAKPFIVPEMIRLNGDATIIASAPSTIGGAVNLPVEVKVPLSNSSQHPALNISVRVSAPELNADNSIYLELPLASNGKDSCAAKLVFAGDAAKQFVQIACGAGIKIAVSVDYASVEGVRWRSSASYMAKVERDQDCALLRAAIDVPAAENRAWGVGEVVQLDFSLVPGSWVYEEVVG